MSDLEAQEFPAGESVKVEREGLPPGYRMRADPHYVELLASSGGRAERQRPEPRGSLRDEAAAAPARAVRDRRLLDQLAEDIAAIESAAAMLGADPSPLARRVSLDLIKAQAARAAWLLRAQAFLGGTAPDPTDRVVNLRPIGAVLAQVRDRVAAECRLVGVGLRVATDEAGGVPVDEATLSLGVAGAVMALLGLAAGTDGAAIRVEPLVEGGDLRAIDVTQESVPVTAAFQQRFFDAGWVERPGGWLAAVGAATARSAAERLGGGASLEPGDRRGCTIRLRFA